MRILILIIAMLPLFSADCVSGADQSRLFGNKWWLTKIYTNEGTRTIADKKPFVRFDKEKNSAGGNGSCNSFGSTLKLDNNRISITEIFSTKMYCEGVQAIEDLFLGDLGRVNRYELKGNILLLYQDKELLLEFEGEEIVNSQ